MKRRVVGLIYRSSARAASTLSSPAVEAAPRSKPGEPAYLHTLTGSCRPDRASPNAWQSHHVFKVAAAALGVGGLTGFGTGYGVGTTNFGKNLSASAADVLRAGWSGLQNQVGWTVSGGSAPPAIAVPQASPVAGFGLGPNFIADAAAKAAPAVVSVSAQPTSNQPRGQAASGFIVSADGTLVTNAHILEDLLDPRSPPSEPLRGACAVTVTLQDGRVFQGRIANLDRSTDLAVVKIESGKPLPVAELGTAQGLRVGEWVLALGSPLALHNTVTAGIVSCTSRQASELGLLSGACKYIQTDVAINSGNSGGPLVDLQGRVVGVSFCKAMTATGVSFAIPIDCVTALLAEGPLGARPVVGLKLLQLDGDTVARLKREDPKFPPVQQGLLVPAVTPGSPAHHAGMQAGDVITGWEGAIHHGRQEFSTEQLVQCFADNIGRPVSLSVRRGTKQTLRLKVVPQRAC